MKMSLNIIPEPFSVETLVSDYFDPDAIKTPAYPIARFHKGGKRFYYVPSEEITRAYPSATTITKTQMAPGASLLKWIGDQGGYHNAEAVKNDRAHYGTVMHMLIEEFLGGVLAARVANRQTDKPKQRFVMYQEDLVSLIRDYMDQHGLPPIWMEQNVKELFKDMAAFYQFYKDAKVEPILIENSLINFDMGYAATVDLVAYITVREKGFFGETYKRDSKATGAKAGDPKETYADVRKLVCINFKSGRKGTYPETKVQLHLEKMAVESNFPDLGEIEACYKWSPKAWKTAPTYELTEISQDSTEWKKTHLLVEAANLDFENVLDQSYKTSILEMAFGDEGEEVLMDQLSVRQYLQARHSGNFLEIADPLEPTTEAEEWDDMPA